MFSHRLAPLILAASLIPALQAAETWEGAAQRLMEHARKEKGRGAIVHLERVDAQTVRIRLKALWPGFRGASIQSTGEAPLEPRAWQIEAAAGLFERTATIDPRATRLEVRLQGSDFNPKLMLRLPAPGQAEVGMVLLGGMPGA